MTKKNNPEHEEHTRSASDEHQVRLAKVEEMHKAGIEPWPSAKEVNADCAQVIAEFDQEAEKKTYAIAGRVLIIREHGKTMFMQLQDRTGRLQLYLRKDVLGEEAFKNLHHLVDVGDILWVTGTSFKTKMGEITLRVQDYTLLSKCLYPLPEKFHGLVDVETKYRQRYLDLISSPESREKFKTRSKLMTAMRAFFEAHDFMEVETPMLHPIPGGAAAKPFVTHHNALHSDFYLRVAPELYLKRLVIGGFERVFEINRSFRNEGISTRHNPEFTMAEFYIAYKDYHFMMDLVEELIKKLVATISDTAQLPYGEHTIDYGKPFARMTMIESICKYGDCTADELTQKSIDALLKKKNISVKPKAVYGKKVEAAFEYLAEAQLIQPTFITDYPIDISPLTKRDPNNPDSAPRFELFVGGMELSNGFNELNEPFDQAARFHEQAAAHAAGDDEAHYYDADYVLALEHGLPPTVGAGIGIDRLVMLLTNTPSIKDVILFPTLKSKVD